MSHYWRENHFMVVQGPALGKVLSLPGVVPVGFKTSGWPNNVCSSSCTSGHLPGEHSVKHIAHAGTGKRDAGAGRRVFHQELIPTWPPIHQNRPILDGTVVWRKRASPVRVSFAERNEPSLTWVACDCLQVLFSPVRELILWHGWLVDSLCRNFKCMVHSAAPLAACCSLQVLLETSAST